MVHRERTDHEVEGGVLEGQRLHIADHNCRPSRIRGGVLGVRLCPRDHRRIEVQAGDIEPMIASEPHRQVAGPGTNL